MRKCPLTRCVVCACAIHVLCRPVETPKAKPRAGRIPMSAYKQGMKVKIRGPEFHNKKMQRKLRAYMGTFMFVNTNKFAFVSQTSHLLFRHGLLLNEELFYVGFASFM